MSLLQSTFADTSFNEGGSTPKLGAGLHQVKIKEVKKRIDKEKNVTNDIVVTFVGTGENNAGKEWSWYAFENNYDESRCTEDWHKQEFVRTVLRTQKIISAFFDESAVASKFAAVKSAGDVMSLINAALSHEKAQNVDVELKLLYRKNGKLDLPKGGMRKDEKGIFTDDQGVRKSPFVADFITSEVNPKNVYLSDYDKQFLNKPEAPAEQADPFATSAGASDDPFSTPTLAANEDPFA